jgi:hypothetical protein
VQVVEGALANAGMSKDDVDWLVCHQANQRILDAAAQRLGMPTERVVRGGREGGRRGEGGVRREERGSVQEQGGGEREGGEEEH